MYILCVFCQDGECLLRSPNTGSCNDGCTTSDFAKTLADFSVSLRTQLTRLSVSSKCRFL